MEVLHTEIQALQKLLFHIHQVRAKQAHWARSYIRSAHKKINVSILLYYICHISSWLAVREIAAALKVCPPHLVTVGLL